MPSEEQVVNLSTELIDKFNEHHERAKGTRSGDFETWAIIALATSRIYAIELEVRINILERQLNSLSSELGR